MNLFGRGVSGTLLWLWAGSLLLPRLELQIMRVVPMTRNEMARRWTSWLLWCRLVRRSEVFGDRRNIYDIHLLGVSRRIRTNYLRQAICLDAGHHRENDLDLLQPR